MPHAPSGDGVEWGEEKFSGLNCVLIRCTRLDFLAKSFTLEASEAQALHAEGRWLSNIPILAE